MTRGGVFFFQCKLELYLSSVRNNGVKINFLTEVVQKFSYDSSTDLVILIHVLWFYSMWSNLLKF